MKLNDFLTTDLLGNKFVAVNGYSEVKNHETGNLEAYRLSVSIQDENSPFFMEMIQLKVKNLSPSMSIEVLKNNKTTPIIIKDMQMGQYNGNLWFSSSDILPYNSK